MMQGYPPYQMAMSMGSTGTTRLREGESYNEEGQQMTGNMPGQMWNNPNMMEMGSGGGQYPGMMSGSGMNPEQMGMNQPMD